MISLLRRKLTELPALVRGGMGSVIIKGINAILMFVLASVMARSLGIVQFGQYSLVLSILAVISIPAQLGLPNLVVRETARSKQLGKEHLIPALWTWTTRVVMTFSVVLTVIIVLGTWILEIPAIAAIEKILLVGLITVPLNALGNLRGASLRGLGVVLLGQVPEFVIRPALITVTMVVFISFGASVTAMSAILAHVIAGAIAFLVGIVLLRATAPKYMQSFRDATRDFGADIRVWRRSAAPLAMFEGLLILNQNVGVILLGIAISSEEVGLYRAALQMAALVAFGLSAANLSMAPTVARLYSAGKMQSLQRAVTQSARLVLAIAIPIAIIFVIWGEPILHVIFGSQFRGAHETLIVLLIGQVVNAYFSSVGVLLNMTGHERLVVKGASFAFGTNIIVALLGVYILNLDMVGVAAAAALSVIVLNLYLWSKAKNLLGIDSSPFGITERL